MADRWFRTPPNEHSGQCKLIDYINNMHDAFGHVNLVLGPLMYDMEKRILNEVYNKEITEIVNKLAGSDIESTATSISIPTKAPTLRDPYNFSLPLDNTRINISLQLN